MWVLTVFGADITMDPLQPLASLIACFVGYKLVAMVVSGSQVRFGKQEWKLLIAAGVLSSFLNGFSNSMLYGSAQLSLDIFGYMIGDVLGQIALMLGLIYILKFIRLFKVQTAHVPIGAQNKVAITTKDSFSPSFESQMGIASIYPH